MLQLLALGIPDVMNFDFTSKPSPGKGNALGSGAAGSARGCMEERPSCCRQTSIVLRSEGDHLTLLNIYRAFKKVNANKEWCRENFVNSRNMSMVGEVRAQLREICLKLSMKLESCGSDTGRVRRCLAHGLFVNAAELQPDGSYTALDTHQPVAIHPSSVLFQAKPAYVVFNELLHTSKC
ncbi:hypothetical protein J4Q44_G00129400 [Coregonus suidteri]|uniref:RNA helicase n=1 Tax=Coregonus suidteri TaxID=861788 RepID=A0AAN8QUX8_9TELE